MNFLAQVRSRKEAEIAALKSDLRRTVPLRDPVDPVRAFGAAARGSGGIIAEVKRRSPSRPDMAVAASPADLARWYQRAGAVALSVVTDQAAFGTSLADLAAMRSASRLPVLAKDFVLDEIQVRIAWAAGADAVLLIARLLDAEAMQGLLRVVHGLGLEALVECHDEQDVAGSLAAGARIVGINNRDLASLTTDLGRTAGLLPRVPAGIVLISESGLQRRADVAGLAALGVDAFLVGHALLLSGDPGRKLRELNGREDEKALRVKICGLTTPQDALLCHRLGADLLGVIFAGSPRRVGEDSARAIRAAVPDARLCGVFADADSELIAATARRCGLDLIQLHGQETPGQCRELAAMTGIPLIKALTPDAVGPETVRAYAAVKYFLVDQPKGTPGAPSVGVLGWRPALASLARQGAEVILAGGFDAASIRTLGDRAGDAVRPFAIDICRGVESVPGRKDPRRVRHLMQEVIR